MMASFYNWCEELFSQNVSFKSFLAVILPFVLLLLIISWLRNQKRYNTPPGPIGVPFLGYVPFLGSEPFRTLFALRKKYGSVFGLYLGRNYVVFIQEFEAVKEALSKSTTTDRPEQLFGLIPDEVGFSSVNGEAWVEQRRYCLKVMKRLGMGRDVWEKLVAEEVEDFMKMLIEYKGQPSNICRLLAATVSNNISTLVFGKRLPMNEQNIDFLNMCISAVENSIMQVSVRNYFPWLDKILSKLGIGIGAYSKELIEFNQYVRDQVECRERLDEKDSENFIDGYLTEIKNNEENNLNNSFNYRNLYGNIQALFIGASDTARTSINWLLLIMATYMDIQKKVQKEIDSVLGREGKIQWAERNSLPFTYAVIMEGQRWKTVAPLDTARIAMEDIKIQGYDIPKGTTIISGIWALHNDPEYWEDPSVFRPERFLSADGKQINFKPDSYIPFSYGKRNCPGETMAMVEILLYFVSFMQKFLVLPPEGQVPCLEGSLGLIYQAQPQELRFIRRE